MPRLDFGGMKEDIVTREEFPLAYAREVLGKGPIATLGYGIQGRGQALNMRDSEFPVIVGQRPEGPHYAQALKDGWEPGSTLVSVDEAAERGPIKQYLLTDAGQKEYWDRLKEFLKPGDTLVFSHGFSIVYHDQTGVVPPKDVDVVL